MVGLTFILLLVSTLKAYPVECGPVLEWLSKDNGLEWVKASVRPEILLRKWRPENFDSTQVFQTLPSKLKAKLQAVDQNGFLKIDRLSREALEAHCEKVIRQRLLNLKRAPEDLRQLDLWMHDMNGKEAGFAIRQALRPEVGFFGVGHGEPGGDRHELYPITLNGVPLVRVRMDVEKIIDLYSKLPGVRSSKVLFYKTFILTIDMKQ
ncbi:hypothetical protein EBT16_10835 [bacterium]|nr:hypothetical protein [bacterium]